MISSKPHGQGVAKETWFFEFTKNDERYIASLDGKGTERGDWVAEFFGKFECAWSGLAWRVAVDLRDGFLMSAWVQAEIFWGASTSVWMGL